MRRRFAALAGLIALTLPATVALGDAAATEPTPARLEGPARAWDGDTLEVAGYRVRLNGVDAPEMRGDARGPVARAAMDDILMGREVVCDISGKSHDRVVGRCFLNGDDVGEALIRKGWAFEHRKYTDDYAAAEAEARAEGRGFWARSSSESEFQKIAVIISAMSVLAVLIAALLPMWLSKLHRKEDQRKEARTQQRILLNAATAIWLGCDFMERSLLGALENHRDDPTGQKSKYILEPANDLAAMALDAMAHRKVFEEVWKSLGSFDPAVVSRLAALQFYMERTARSAAHVMEVVAEMRGTSEGVAVSAVPIKKLTENFIISIEFVVGQASALRKELHDIVVPADDNARGSP